MEQKAHSNRWYFDLIPPLFLSVITALVYYPSLNYEFQFDDIANITKHFNIRHYSLKQLFFSGPRWISYWLNSLHYKLGRFEPFSYRVGNVLIHIMAGILLFFLLKITLLHLKKDSFFKTNAPTLAFLTALFFLLHPVQTQTVSYVIQGQLEGLAALLILSMALVFTLLTRVQSIVGKIILTLLFFSLTFLSSGTKEIAIISPAVILLVDWFLLAQGDWRELKKRWWLYTVLSTMVLSIYLYLLKPRFFTDILGFKRTAINNIGNVITHNPKSKITPGVFFISQFKVILHYLWMFIWPFNISVEYDWKVSRHFFAPDSFLPFLMLSAIAGIVLYHLRKNSASLFAFGALWFFVCIAPRSSIIPSSELLVDYKTYLASVGWLFLLAAGLIKLVQAIPTMSKQFASLARQSYTKPALLSSFTLFLGLCAFQRNTIWRSGLEFWANIIRNAPGKARAYNNYGVELSQVQQKFKESIPYFKKAISMDKNYPDPCNNLAVAYSQIGKIDLAIEALKGGLRINPYYPEGYNNLASFYVQQKKYDEAEKILKTALRLRPHYGKAYFNLGRVYLEQNRLDDAFECFKNCCTQADLDNEFGFTVYAKASMQVQKYDDAIFAYKTLIQLNPTNPEHHFNLANAYFLDKKYTVALPIYQHLTQQNPQDIRSWYNMGETCLHLNKPQEALTAFERIQDRTTEFPHLPIRIAACYEKTGNPLRSKQLLEQLLVSPAPDNVKGMARGLITQLNEAYKNHPSFFG